MSQAIRRLASPSTELTFTGVNRTIPSRFVLQAEGQFQNMRRVNNAQDQGNTETDSVLISRFAANRCHSKVVYCSLGAWYIQGAAGAR